MSADPVNPQHYDGDACMRLIEQLGAGVGYGMCIGNAVKYLWRQGIKHERIREDVAKAKWYLARARSYDDLATSPDGTQLTPDQLHLIDVLEGMADHVLAVLSARETPLPDLRERLQELGCG